ncbi:hypothetical protein [Streptomyces sp. NPDC059631]|uniref:hypothetical protein n=1 Tax=unclassified Streptomyces TaxID=2593676 RepID=UPI0036C715F0
MTSPVLAHLAPVAALLNQGSAPADVPDDPDILQGGWRPGAVHQALGLIKRADPQLAGRSFTAAGHTHLLLAQDTKHDCLLYLRLHAEGIPEPQAATETTVTLTLAGTSYVECYRHQGDIDEDHPWLVRTFAEESIYACHPGTLRTIATGDDGCQLVLARTALAPPVGATPLTAYSYREALGTAQRILTAALPGDQTAAGVTA